MITPEQIVDVLKNYNKEGGIYDIKISPNVVYAHNSKII